MTDPDAKAVEAALKEVADMRPAVPDQLMRAVLQDAAWLQPAAGRTAAAQPGIWAQFLELVGGWPAVGGLAAAGVAGVWLGAAPPVGLEAAAATWLGETQTVDLFGDDVLAVFEVSEDVQ